MASAGSSYQPLLQPIAHSCDRAHIQVLCLRISATVTGIHRGIYLPLRGSPSFSSPASCIAKAKLLRADLNSAHAPSHTPRMHQAMTNG